MLCSVVVPPMAGVSCVLITGSSGYMTRTPLHQCHQFRRIGKQVEGGVWGRYPDNLKSRLGRQLVVWDVALITVGRNEFGIDREETSM